MTEETTTPVVVAPWAKPATDIPPEVTPPADTAPEEKPDEETTTPVVADAAEGEVMVTVMVPKAFNLTMSPSQTIKVPAGVQEMTLAQAEHWYSKANGVSIYNPSKGK